MHSGSSILLMTAGSKLALINDTGMKRSVKGKINFFGIMRSLIGFPSCSDAFASLEVWK